ncbi:hypothetical protein [Sediminicola arcticus]|jgi:hypothetical protein|uniref:Uncharacterized protein n=1 Tax=Sediminicola arcticus TaxID=1574308 RepID=A0ABV2SY14_9FLAO
MFKFFRKIRYNLMGQNKTGKYFKYAIGEIILVVVGILIALWLNNLNLKSQQRIEEINILKGLKKDFQEDIIDFKLNINAYKNISSSVDLVLNSLESSAIYNDSLDYYFSGTITWPRSIINKNSFDVLKSKGLDLISNDSLRNEILNFHGQVYAGIKTWEDQFNRDIYFNEMLKRFDKVEPWKFDKDGKFYRGVMKPINYNALKTDTLYLSLLRTMKRDAETLLYSEYLTTIKDLKSLVADIDKELINIE